MPKRPARKGMKKRTKTKKESFFARIKQRSKRQLIRLGIILITAIITISILSYAISVNVKLLFDTETHITLSPSITSITTPMKDPVNVTFTTTIDKLSVCDITCEHLLMDETNDKTINKTTMEAEKLLQTTYNLPLIGTGRGQSVFTYTITCTTTDKALCPSKGKQHKKTAFVTVNYDLSPQEAQLKEELEQTLPRQTALLAGLHTTMDETISTINALGTYADMKETSFSAALVKKRLLDADMREEALLTSWSEEYYTEAWALLEEHERLTDETATTVEELARKTTAQRQAYMTTVNRSRSIHQQKSMASGWTGFLTRADPQAYTTLKNASEKYDTMMTTRASPHQLLEEADNITKTIRRTESAYIIARAEQKSWQEDIRSLYEQHVTEANHTWEGDSCEHYQNIITLLNETNTSTQRIAAYTERYCPELPDEQLFTATPLPEIIITNTTAKTPKTIPQPTPYCCHKDACKPCDASASTPVILVHGHSFSKSTSPELAFTRLSNLQAALAKNGYLHASTIDATADLKNIPAGDWGRQPAPIAISVTYYYMNYLEVGQLSLITRKTDSIENYAIRLKEAIETVREKTGAQEVIIIAHSMGGLVAREYLTLFGEERVEKLIILGTPNHGVEGDIRKYCTLTGAKQECDEMAVNSPFLKRLNEQRNTPTKTKVYTIRAEGCPTTTDEGKRAEGDGVVLASSVILNFAQENYVIQGTCTDLLQKSLHMDFVNPELYPETYELIKDILHENRKH